MGGVRLRRGERGQGALEYMLLFVLAAMLAVAVLAVFHGGLQRLYAACRDAAEPWLRRLFHR